MSFVYLASPYTHPSEAVRELRFRAIEIVSSDMLVRGITVFSPIVYCHVISQRFNLPTDAGFWLAHNRAMLKAAEALWVVMFPGWETSVGLKGEMLAARDYGKRVTHVNPATWGAGSFAEALSKLA